jgi:hypothetical protein
MNKINEADVPALPPPGQPVQQPVQPGRQVDAEKIKRQYETLKKVAADRAATENEKNVAKKKMSEFEKTYQDILKKHKGVPQGPAPTAVPKPSPQSSQPIVPAAPAQQTNVPPVQTPPQPQQPPVQPAAQPAAAAAPKPPAPAAPKPPVVPTSTTAPNTAPNNFSNTYNNLFPKSAKTPIATPAKQPSPRPYNIGQLQQQFQNVRPNTPSPSAAGGAPRGAVVQSSAAGQKPSGPGLISRVAAMPVQALQKGIGAYSKIVNAPRALGQSLKAAAAGEPYQLQQQIGTAAQKAGFTAVPPAEPSTPAAAQQYTKQQKIDDLVQRIRKNPNDQQAIMALKSI